MSSIMSRSPWLVHVNANSCNGCDIELLACLTPIYDAERLGVLNIGTPKQADIMLVTGSINYKNMDVVLNIYNQIPNPKVVVAVGACACSGGIFHNCYNVIGGADKIVPVDVFVPGCCPKPETIIEGIAKGAAVLDKKRLEMKQKGIKEVSK